MLFSQTSQDFRKQFLLAFTAELIRATNPHAFFELEKEIEDEEREKKKIHGIIVQEKKLLTPKNIISLRGPRILRIPEPKLPPRLSYLLPTPTNFQLDLGKLNPFINNPRLESIEVTGPDEPVMIKIPAPQTTEVTLTKEEIDYVINTFSESSKIPISEGLYRVAVGSFILSAIISEITGSKFIIKRIPSMREQVRRRF